MPLAPADRSLEADTRPATDPAAIRGRRIDRRAVTLGIWLTAIVALFGIIARFQIMMQGLARPQVMNVFFRLYALYELPFLLLVLLTAIVAAIALRRSGRADDAGAAWLDRPGAPSLVSFALVGAIALGVALAAGHFALHGYALSMDEFSTDFQARIFAHGRRSAELPAFWRSFVGGITPIFVRADGAGTWQSTYLPVYALLQTPFVALGIGALLNPLLACLSLIALGAVAKRLWPDERLRPWLAVGFLATSSEFLLTSGSGYSMPAHLCLNLLWLWLYLRDDAPSWAGALVVGVLALGLHNPFPHALFVAPFLLRLVTERRWKRVASAALVYGAGSVYWLLWLRSSYSAEAQGSGMLGVFAMPNVHIFWLQGITLSLLYTWQAPLFGVLIAAALLQAKRLDRVLRDLAWGLLLTLAFYLFFPFTQGHGWGNRYAYQVLGNMALLAAAGASPLREAMGRRRMQLALAASFVIAVGAMLPARLVRAERFTRPFAAGAEYLKSRPADVVLVHGDSIWYGRDLVRNDPFLKGQPVIMSAWGLTPAGRSALERAYPGRVVEVTDTDLLRLGMTRWANHPF
jgi:hypothetical protein